MVFPVPKLAESFWFEVFLLRSEGVCESLGTSNLPL